MTEKSSHLSRTNHQSPFSPSPQPSERGSKTPLALTKAVANREIIIAASEEARAAHVRPGMTLAEGRALCAGLEHGPHDAERDARGLIALARWMTRFTPVVQVQSQSPESLFQFAIFLDLSGCERVFGGIEKLVAQIFAALERLGLTARTAVAPNPGAAWALTFGKEIQNVPQRHRGTEKINLSNSSSLCLCDSVAYSFAACGFPIYEPSDLPKILPRLPVEGLRLEEEIVAVLRHLGIDTIQGLEKLPRDALPARFGEKLVRRVDQLYGRAIEPLTPLPFCKPIVAEVDFDGVVGAPEALWEVMRQLLAQVVGELVKRGCGARTVQATFVLPEGEPIQKTIHLSSASRDAGTLFNLLRCAMEMLIPATGRQQRKRRAFDPVRRRVVRYVPEGFVGLRLEVLAFERLSEEQVSLLEQEALDADRELSRLVERLRVKLGERVVARAACVEAYLPEMGWRWETEEGENFSDADPGRRLRLPPPACGKVMGAHRPLHLLQTPVEVRVMVSPSHDRDGRPVAFVHEGKTHAVPFAVGPERLCGPWWLGRHKTRDYFDAADEGGGRFWLFRVLETGKWYLHGMFR